MGLWRKKLGESMPPPMGALPLDRSRFFPYNISGTYKGNWESLSRNLTLSSPRARVLKREQGVIIYQLTTTPSKHPDVQYVHGEVVLREGLYVTDEDLHLMLEGVYVRPEGTLHVMMHSDMQELLDVEEVEERGVEYRAALRQVSQEAVWAGRLPETSQLATDQANHSAPLAESMNLTLSKRCRFSMKGKLLDLTEKEREASGEKETRLVPASGRRGGADGKLPMHTLEFDGELVSSNCGVNLHINTTSIQLQAYYDKAINYTLMVTCLSVVQVMLLVKQMDYSNTQAAAAKISLMMIGHQAILDAYLCLLHLTVGIVMEQLFNAFATAAFFEFLTFSMFEMRYMLTIWKARQGGQFDTWGSLRRELSVLYSRFYGFLLTGLVVVYQMQGMMRWVLLLFYSFWWPQIIRNAYHDIRRPLHPHFIIGVTATRLVIPLYIYGCPYNFVRQAPDHTFCMYLTAYSLLQACLLLLQHYAGPRCLVPAFLLPVKYNYYRKVDDAVARLAAETDIETGGEEVDCVICMSGINVSNPNHRMVSPCDHFFHPQCLQRWMDVKMECPTCRRALPPL